MSVALNDKLTCQHVLRILTGIQDLVVKEVCSQYRISKIISRDAILDILSEDSRGLMQYFKSADPEDMSQGELLKGCIF